MRNNSESFRVTEGAEVTENEVGKTGTDGRRGKGAEGRVQGAGDGTEEERGGNGRTRRKTE